MNFENLLHPLLVRDLVQGWLREDTTSFDYGGFVVGTQQSDAIIICKQRAILAGIPFANAVFRELGCAVSWEEVDGSCLEPIARVASVAGPARNLLLAERIVLNCLSRASGVATVARKFKSKIDAMGWKGELTATRKTTPGFRMVEKYSVLVGGANTHRYDLSGMIMLKDNHIKIAGNIRKAVELAKKTGGFSQKIEVECSSEEEALEAANSGADVVMLDNFSPEKLHEVAGVVKKRFPTVLIEASGRVTFDNVESYVGQNIDVISTSSLVQGYATIDFSMNVST